jgi:hypothetical protein
VSRATVVIELAGDAGSSRDLAAGGVFVPGCRLALSEECDLVVCGASHQLTFAARVVYVDELRGAGLELIGFSTEMKARIAELGPIGPADLEFLEPASDDALPDGPAFEDPPLPDDDLGPGGSGGSVPLIDLLALEDALEDDLALPICADDDRGRRADDDRGRRADDDRGRRADDDRGRRAGALEADAADAADDDLAVPVASAAGDTDAYSFVDEPAADRRVGDADAVGDDAAHDRAALYDGVLDNRADFDPANPDHAYLMSGKTLPPDSAIGYADIDEALDDAFDDDREGEPADPHAADPDAGADDDDLPDGPPGAGSASGDAIDPREPATATPRAARNVHERLRGLTLAAQLKVAVSGEQHERIVLERLYGKNVWETLLRNPRLTPPEVARIARYGSLPRVLLEIIVGNNAWLQVPEVRRALLSNPRLGTDQIMKILRLVPKHELKLAAIQTAYPHAVRNAARLILRSE